ncbi:hypothetical protein [Haladaptatus sp.]|uniref:hypothetical protein n=1 Tax=Haladaptatus sp. TaxID=1973141 RepID=UPI003C352524
MNAKSTVSTVFGGIVALLGLLWIVQGLGIVQIDPILCVADCEPITGGSVQWTIVGVLALFVGVAIVRWGRDV